MTHNYSNGSGFVDIDVGNFTAVLIQSADGEFVSTSMIPWSET